MPIGTKTTVGIFFQCYQQNSPKFPKSRLQNGVQPANRYHLHCTSTHYQWYIIHAKQSIILIIIVQDPEVSVAPVQKSIAPATNTWERLDGVAKEHLCLLRDKSYMLCTSKVKRRVGVSVRFTSIVNATATADPIPMPRSKCKGKNIRPNS